MYTQEIQGRAISHYALGTKYNDRMSALSSKWVELPPCIQTTVNYLTNPLLEDPSNGLLVPPEMTAL